MTRSRLCLVSLVLAASFLTSEIQAGSPRLSRLSPPGGQRGTVVEVVLSGRYLDEPEEILFYEPGIQFEGFEKVETAMATNGRMVSVEAGSRVKVRLKLAEDCPLGPHGLRVRTRSGLTDYQQFFVGPYPTVDEGELPLQPRNDTRETAKAIQLNVTVFGRILEQADVDYYRVEMKRGQRISAEVEAARLGVDRGIPDMHLAIYNEAGESLAVADDSALFVQDPVLSILAPRDGAYFIEVRHSMYGGLGDQYRLHVGTFTRPTAIYPAGGPAGSELKVEILGDPRGRWAQTVKLPGKPGDFAFTASEPGDNLPSPSPNTLRVSPFPNVLEAEPNNSPDELASAPVANLPVALNGIIDKPGDVDCFVFRAKKGQQLRIHALANALGSPVDPVIWVKPLKGTSAGIRASDSRPNQLGLAPYNGLHRVTHDPVLEFTTVTDGEYVVGIENERGEGGSDHVYRIEITLESNAIHTYIATEPENQNAPQLRQAIVIPAGNRWTSQIAIFNTSRAYTGELELVGVNLPKGVTVHAPKLMPGMTRVPVVFEAEAGVKPQAALIDLHVRPVNKTEEPFGTGYRQTILMNQYGNNDYYLHTPITQLALAVTESAPFEIEVEQPKTSLVQNGEMPLKFRVKRAPGYEGPVTVQMDWKPNGVLTATPVTVPADKTEGTYLLGASRNASAGKYLVTLTAMSGSGRAGYNDGTNRTYAASKLFPLTVSEPHVEARIARTSIERGKITKLVCKLNHLQAFEGTARATLARLPRGIELVEPVKEIRAGDSEVTFTLKATAEALVGNYQGIALDLTVNDKGQSVRQLSGYGMLRVDAERGVRSNP